MVAMFNKELLSWYLITLKLRETIEYGIATTPTSSKSVEFSDQIQQNLQKQQQEPSESLQIVVVNGNGRFEEGLKSPESEVPHYLREGDAKAYFPQIVSLGPYHHGRRHLYQMDRHKWHSLHHVLKRTNHDISFYLNSIKELKRKARSCYEGPINLSTNEFVEMMVLDACFVLELICGAIGRFKHLGYPRKDPIFAMRGAMHSIQRDMIMLENQIPLFILNQLLGLQLGDPDQRGFVAKLAIQFFDPLMPTDEPLTKSDRNKLESSLGYTTTLDPLFDQSGLHCLDVFGNYMR